MHFQTLPRIKKRYILFLFFFFNFYRLIFYQMYRFYTVNAQNVNIVTLLSTKHGERGTGNDNIGRRT